MANRTGKLFLAVSISFFAFSTHAQDYTMPVENITVVPQSVNEEQPIAPMMPSSAILEPVAPPAPENSSLPKSMQVNNPVPQEPVLPMVTQSNPVAESIEDQFVAKFANLPTETITQKTVTMEELLSVAYETNPGLVSAREAIKAVDEGVSQASSGYLPSASYGISRDKTEESVNSGSSNTLYPRNDALTVRQGLFSGGATYYSVRSAESKVLSARSELKKAEQDFMLEAITSYVEYIYTQKVLKLAENNETVLQEQLKAVQDRFVVGDATKTDVAQSEARLANAKSNKVIANGDFVNARANFKRIFSVDAPAILPMPTSLPNVPGTLDDAVREAFDNNPQLTQLKHLINSNENDINVQRAALLPQVDVDGSVGQRSSSNFAGGLTKTEDETIGLNVTIPIYNKGIEYSRMRQAKDRRNQTTHQYNNTKNIVKSGVVQAWQQLSTTATNIEATKSSLVASEFALDGVREENKEGVRTVLDVLDAEQERFVAETAHARAIKDGLLAVYKLKSVLGELSPKELNLSVPEYNPEEHYKNTRFKFIGL